MSSCLPPRRSAAQLGDGPSHLCSSPTISELEAIRAILQESEKTMEKLEEQEDKMIQELNQRAQDLRTLLPKPHRLHRPERCLPELLPGTWQGSSQMCTCSQKLCRLCASTKPRVQVSSRAKE